MPARDELPDTIKRSPRKAQQTWLAAHDAAAAEYGEGGRAHRTAYAALKHSFEKVGDHWEPKAHRGPSDEQAAGGGPARHAPTAGGVDANAPKQHLMEVAGRLGIRGRSRMTRPELVNAIEEANRRAFAADRPRRDRPNRGT